MTDHRWQQLLRLIDETFADYLSGLVALRKRVVADLKRRLADGKSPDSAARRPRAGGRRSPR